MAVAAVDENVTFLDVGQKMLDHFVHCLSGLDHHHDLPRTFETVNQLLQRVCPENVLPPGPAFDKILYLVSGAIED